MDKRLSILHSDEEEIDLQTNRWDVLAAFVRGTIGAAPEFGPMIAEIITSRIPEQKLDRVCRLAGLLELKVKFLTDDVNSIKDKLQSEEGSDLLEDALNQASRATSPERLEYIASLLKNGLTSEDIDHIGKKKLLSILNELNDAEIVTLKYHSFQHLIKQQEFAKEHTELFTPIPLPLGSSQQDIDKAALRDTYRKKLIDLGLLRATYKKLKKGELPDFDERTGMPKAQGYTITSLGKLLLRYIDLAESE